MRRVERAGEGVEHQAGMVLYLRRQMSVFAPGLRLLHLVSRAAVVLLAMSPVACAKRAPPLGKEGAPIFTTGAPADARRLVAAGFGTCAKRKDGIWCWGAIGDGASREAPSRIEVADVTDIALGESHYCVLDKSRHVACAGRNLDGELGDPVLQNRSTLANVAGLSNVVQLVAASFKTCAIVEAGAKREVYCFGADERRSKEGLPSAQPQVTRIGDIDDARELAAARGLGCARRADGSVWCWGSDDYDQLGDGTMPFGKRPQPTSRPVRVLHVGDAVGISAGGFSACVLTARGTVGCWGNNSYGGLGDGTTRQRGYASAVVGLDDVAQIAMGGFAHTCALRRGGDVWCWGYRIGASTGQEEGQKTAVRVAGLEDATEIASGHTHTCARRKNGSVLCWGDNSEGQLGDGTRRVSATPREVLGPE